MSSLSLLQGIFLTQGLNWGLHCRQIFFLTNWAIREALAGAKDPTCLREADSFRDCLLFSSIRTHRSLGTVTKVAICQLQVDEDESGRSRAPRRIEPLLKLLVRICSHPSLISLPSRPSTLHSLPPTPPPSIFLRTSSWIPPPPSTLYFPPLLHQHLFPPLHTQSLFSQLFDNPPGGLPTFFLSLFIPQALQQGLFQMLKKQVSTVLEILQGLILGLFKKPRPQWPCSS